MPDKYIFHHVIVGLLEVAAKRSSFVIQPASHKFGDEVNRLEIDKCPKLISCSCCIIPQTMSEGVKQAQYGNGTYCSPACPNVVVAAPVSHIDHMTRIGVW